MLRRWHNLIYQIDHLETANRRTVLYLTLASLLTLRGEI
jgi:hypothetical protein